MRRAKTVRVGVCGYRRKAVLLTLSFAACRRGPYVLFDMYLLAICYLPYETMVTASPNGLSVSKSITVTEPLAGRSFRSRSGPPNR